MVVPIRLQVSADPDGGWRVGVGLAGSTTEAARLSSERVREVSQAAAALSLGPSGAASAAEIASWAQRELHFGRVLGGALASMPVVWAAFQRALWLASSARAPALIALDIDDHAAQALPWELLADGPQGNPLAEARRVVFARLSRGGGGFTLGRPGVFLRLLIWAPDAHDPVVAALCAALRATASEGLAHLITLSADTAPAFIPGALDVLVVVAHGDGVDVALGQLLRSSGGMQTDPTPGLTATLRGAAVVFLAVCEGDSASEDRLDNLASRTLAAGARAVIAPCRPVTPDVLRAALDGVLGVLTRRATLAEAYGAGLAAMSSLERTLAYARWWTLHLALAHADLGSAGLGDLHLPPPLPWPGSSALVLMERAAVRARVDGYLGLEHLALALGVESTRGPVAARARVALRRVAGALEEALSGYKATGLPRPDDEVTLPSPERRALPLSPRLRRLIASLSPGFDEDALWLAILDLPVSPLPWLAALVGRLRDLDPDESLEPRGPRPTPQPTALLAVLEVVGGPEDGRRLRLDPGQTLGRWHPDGPHPTAPLYRDTALVDDRLSRIALRWLGAGQVEVLGRAELYRDGARTVPAPESPLRLQDGDRLILGRTALVARALDRDDEP